MNINQTGHGYLIPEVVTEETFGAVYSVSHNRKKSMYKRTSVQSLVPWRNHSSISVSACNIPAANLVHLVLLGLLERLIQTVVNTRRVHHARAEECFEEIVSLAVCQRVFSLHRSFVVQRRAESRDELLVEKAECSGRWAVRNVGVAHAQCLEHIALEVDLAFNQT